MPTQRRPPKAGMCFSRRAFPRETGRTPCDTPCLALALRMRSERAAKDTRSVLGEARQRHLSVSSCVARSSHDSRLKHLRHDEDAGGHDEEEEEFRLRRHDAGSLAGGFRTVQQRLDQLGRGRSVGLSGRERKPEE
eukprot:scaffold2119_cov264-Pinguiococcus_pyrenoidosus.AAC.3